MSRLDFLQATATSIASSGSGAVTMSDVTGLPGFTDAFGSSARNVDYVIIDTTNNHYEKGYGSVAAMVLTRSIVHETWTGTVYATANTPFAFSASPAANQINIYLAATADMSMPVPPAIQTTNGSSTYKGYELSNHQIQFYTSASGGALGTTNEYYVPFLNLIRGQISGFGIEIGVAGTGGNGVKGAVYEVGSDGMPGQCITQFNALSASSTGWITDTTSGTWAVNAGPIRLVPGWFYIGWMTNDTAVCLKKQGLGGWSARSPLGCNSGYGEFAYASKTQQNSYATGLPSGVPSGSYTLQGANSGLCCPVIGLKIGN